MAAGRTEGGRAADAAEVRPHKEWAGLRVKHLQIDLHEGGELQGSDVVPEALTAEEGRECKDRKQVSCIECQGTPILEELNGEVFLRVSLLQILDDLVALLEEVVVVGHTQGEEAD